jgi:cell fate (sporulation/competence/biofilm development) regulator YmcA (YheA/YmcA/DUF963 family)
MSVSWGSKPTPEERAADKADRDASRNAINTAKTGINAALGLIKKESAKEDYPVLQKILKDMLDWLKANPKTNQDDINDYNENRINSNPLVQSFRIRKQWSDLFEYIQKTVDSRIKYLKEKHPELLASATEILTPALAYRDTILSWFNNGQTTYVPQDYEDKAVEIRAAVLGEDGKGDVFKINAFLDDKKLTKEVIEKHVEDNQIKIPRLLGKIAKYVGYSIVVVFILFGLLIGASYSTNLNYYRSFYFRLFYAVYGGIFFIPVILYEVIYKQWWLRQKFIMHGMIPLFDGPVEHWSWFGKNLFFFFERRSPT